ncbi:4Fe-4S binding protein [Thermodesulfobacteriota bacterium]
MSNKKALFIILFSFELAVIIPLAIGLMPVQKRTRYISINAKKYSYTPSRIVVNKGDTIILRLSSLDISHGFDLDGYPIEMILRKGVMFQKNVLHDDASKHMTNWNRVSKIKFVANRSGKFIFRCTQTCGNLHPFMTGEMVVRPNTPYHLSISISVWIVFSLLIWIRFKASSGPTGFKRIDILALLPWLKRLVKHRGFQFFFILPNFIVFYLFILSSLWGSPVGNRNIAIVFVWILWWFILKAIMVPLGGRIWCLMCPLPAPAEWLSRRRLTAVRYIQKPFKRLHHRFTGLQKDWPKKISNIWLQNILFLALISFGMILITRPIATAVMFLVILAITLLLSLIYRQRVFCLYLCPVGGFLGTYSMASMTEVRAIDPDICKKHKEKECFVGGTGGWACSWNQYVGKMSRNNYCGLCTECIKSCPKDNVSIFIRPFGSDRLLKGYDEMFNVIIMLVVAIAFSITMLGPWGFIKDAANFTESRQIIPFLIYLAVIWSSALLIFPGLFMLTARGASYLARRPMSNRDLTLRLVYILIPVGIFSWIAFSLPAVMINYGYIFSVFSDPLGLGWDLFSTAGAHFKPFYPDWVPVIQGIILLTGLYLGVSRGFLCLADRINNPAKKTKAMILPSLFALGAVNILLRLYMG